MVPQNCSDSHILQNIFLCVQQNKNIHTGLELLEGEWMMTEFCAMYSQYMQPHMNYSFMPFSVLFIVQWDLQMNLHTRHFHPGDILNFPMMPNVCEIQQPLFQLQLTMCVVSFRKISTL